MKPRLILGAILVVLASSLQAGPAEDSIVRQLRDQGFRNIEINRTLLGRLRITARNRSLDREIILNPATGEILRDYWEQRNGSSSQGGIINPPRDDSKPGYGASDDDNDDDRDDDDRDDDRSEDNSGRGNASDRGDDSDNSGSGSGNSGKGGDDGDGESDD